MFISELTKDYSKTLDLYLKEDTNGIGEGLFSIDVENGMIEYQYQVIDTDNEKELVQFHNIDKYESQLVKNEINKLNSAVEILVEKFKNIQIRINSKLINKANKFNWESFIFKKGTPVIEIETKDSYVGISIDGYADIYSEYFPHSNKLSPKEIEMLISDGISIRDDVNISIESINWFEIFSYRKKDFENMTKIIFDGDMFVNNSSELRGFELPKDFFIDENKQNTTIEEIIQFLNKFL